MRKFRELCVMACPHCHTTAAQQQHTCGNCGHGPYCSVRCRIMDFELGLHGRRCRALSDFGVLRGEDAQKTKSARHPIPYQAPPRLRAFALPEEKEEEEYADVDTACQESDGVDFAWLFDRRMDDTLLHQPDRLGSDERGTMRLRVPRLYDGVYVLLGEDAYDIVHEATRTHPEHRFVGGARWSTHASRLGETLGRIHFGLCRDAAGFSVVGTPTRLVVQCDPQRTRTLTFDPDEADVETVDRLAYVLGRLAWTPRPRQKELFTAFATGYKRSARRERREHYAEAVLERMLIYTE